jgi:hypothetical protein
MTVAVSNTAWTRCWILFYQISVNYFTYYCLPIILLNSLLLLLLLKIHRILICEISGSHSGQYEDESLWDIAPCGLVGVDRYFFHHPDDGGSTRL